MSIAEMRRAMDFVHAMENRSFTRAEPARFGTAYFHDDFPIKWALNFVSVTEDSADLTAAALAEDTHRVQGRAGLAHRKIHLDDQALGERLAPGFTELGWIVQRLVFMALRQPPTERPPLEVVEMSNDELRATRIEAELAEDHPGDEARMLTDSRRVTAAATRHRNLVGLIDGEVAGWGELYSDGRTAQMEDIGTLERFRNRGVARAVVLRGADIARSEGHDFFFLIADYDDWPKELYSKLGFEPIGESYEFMMKSK
jgi:ribosomal protein S18 acetylase RimI-like enzyme